MDPTERLVLSAAGWHRSATGRTIDLRSPIDDRLLGRIQALSAAEAREALDQAVGSFRAWSERPLSERAEVLHRSAALLRARAASLAELLIDEIGKTRKEADEEVSRTADLIDYFAEEGRRCYGQLIWGDSFPGASRDKWAMVYREPLGVVLAIAPFNYPLNLSASKIAPALMVGNSVVFKPPVQGSIAAVHMAEAFCEAGVPPGVLTLVTGDPGEIGDALVTDPRVGLIAFTGSTRVGRQIAEKAGMTGLMMELGGKDAAVVLGDADLDLAAAQIVKGAFGYAGQRCTAVKRVLVEEGVADELVRKLTERILPLRAGDPRDSGSSYGPLISDAAAAYVQELVDDAVGKGAACVVAGQARGRYRDPVLLDRVTPQMRIAWEEQFGPALPVMRVAGIDQAVEMANRSAFGLQSCVFSRDLDRAFEVARRLEVGTVNLNATDSRGPDHFPFAGIKDSGLGTQGVVYSLTAMSRLRAITLNLRRP